MEASVAEKFVRSWEAAWNAHDVEGVLSHFHDHAVFASPIARRLLPESGGVLDGKGQIRDYWERALKLIPTLRFVVERYFVGQDTLVIQYRNQLDVVVSEVLLFERGLVARGYGTYLPGYDNPAGLSPTPPA